MLGVGTKLATTQDRVVVLRLLDLTRSLRRAGGIPTGIDRVEHAYLDRFLADDVPCFGLMRTAFGYLLLDRAGLTGFRDGVDAAEQVDLLSRLPLRRKAALTQAESHARHLSKARCLPFGLHRMLHRHLGQGFAYFNVGHSNLTKRVLGAVRQATGEIHVLVHDVIPLEHPQWQRSGTVDPFAQRMARVAQMADRVIFNSDDTRRRAENWMRAKGRVPPSVVAHLGVTVACAATTNVRPHRPYFMALGTIEPRKNHAFLLDVWDRMGPDAPGLLICGARGWENADVFARLDALPPNGPIREENGLGDGAISTLIQGASGVLFPTLAEGFGLPPLEARAQGARVLCNDLTVLREVLGPHATFLSVSEPKNWVRTLKNWEKSPSDAQPLPRFDPPTWDEHFKTVLRLT